MAIAINNKPFNWLNIFILMLIFLLFLYMTSCSCEYHLKKAKAKCSLDQLTDTIWKKDSVFVDRVHKDTAFYFNQSDTVIIKEGRLTMKYFYRDSTVYLSGTCDTIKVIREVPVIVNKTELKDNWSDLKWYLLLIVILFALYKITK